MTKIISHLFFIQALLFKIVLGKGEGLVNTQYQEILQHVFLKEGKF